MDRKRIFSTLVMSICMSMCMSLVMTVVNVGLTELFLKVWINGWGISFLVSLPLSYFLPPMIRKMADKVF